MQSEREYFDNAECFLEATRLIAGPMQNNGHLGWQMFGTPFAVNFACCAELMLKTLIRIETGETPPAIHQLDKLFDLCSEQSRAWIKSQWDARCLPGVLAGKDYHGDAPIPENLAAAFQQASKAIVDWRYPRGSLGMHLDDFPLVVRERIIFLRSDLERTIQSIASTGLKHLRHPKRSHERSPAVVGFWSASVTFGFFLIALRHEGKPNARVSGGQALDRHSASAFLDSNA